MLDWFRNRLSPVKRTTEDRITLGLVSESEAAILPPHQKRLYDKWAAKREKKNAKDAG